MDMSNIYFTFTLISVLYVGVHSNKVLKMNCDTTGYTQFSSSSQESGAIMVSYKDFLRGGKECIRVVSLNIMRKEADCVTVPCTVGSTGFNGRYSFGSALMIAPDSGNKVFKGVFNLGDGKCIKKIYTVKENPFKITSTEDTKNKENDCKALSEGNVLFGNKLIFNSNNNGDINLGMNNMNIESDDTNNDDIEDDSETFSNLGDSENNNGEGEQIVDDEEELDNFDEGDESEEDGTEDSESSEENAKSCEFEAIHIQKVAVLNGKVSGYEKDGEAKTVFGRSFMFTVQKYIKPENDECLKLVSIRNFYDHEVLEKVKISCEFIEPDRVRGHYLRFDGVIYENPPHGVTYVVENGDCFDRKYMNWGGLIQTLDTPLGDAACFALTKRSMEDRLNGVIPGAKPISPEDIAAMDAQIVAVMDGSMRGFTAKGIVSNFASESYEVEVQDFDKDGQCVRVVRIKRDDFDENIEEVKVSCKITGPIVTDDEDIQFNYGNVIYMQDILKGVFVLKDGVCLQRTYDIFLDEIQKTDYILSPQDCFMVTRWRQNERRSEIKLNQQPPPKTDRAPGLMWMLALNDVITGYVAVGGWRLVSAGLVNIKTRDFHGGVDECIRLVVLTIRGEEADSFKVSCGLFHNVDASGLGVVYGKAFTVKPDYGINRFKAIFNMKNEFCIMRIYTVYSRYFITRIFKTMGSRINPSDTECRALREGRSHSDNSMFSDIGSFNIGGNINMGDTVDSGFRTFSSPPPVQGWFRNPFGRIWF